jgi:predicted nucleic acid-binding protein
MAYLLDANVFIQAKNFHYGFDFCPAFWEWLIAANQKGHVFSIEKIGDELAAGNDALATWAGERGSEFFLEADQPLLSALGRVSAWVTGYRSAGQGYEPTAINNFFQVADYYLVAHALAHGLTVVTHEVAAATTKRVKIPNACIGLQIKCVNVYQMLRAERVRFVLEQ